MLTLRALVKNHKKSGWRHILVRKELWDQLDKMRVLTPDGKEALGSVIGRLISNSPKIERVNTQEEKSARGVNTKKGRVNTPRRALSKEISLEDAVNLVKRKGATNQS